MNKIRESAVKKDCLNYLDSLGPICWYYKTNDGVTQGIPDILGCYLGYFFAIEFKRPVGGHVTSIQKITLNKIYNSFGHYCVATSLKHVQSLIEVIKKENDL